MRIVRSLLLITLVFALGACACRARKTDQGDNLPLAGKDGLLQDVNFAFDSYAIDGRARQILESNAATLKSRPELKVEVEGHCDERGTNEYNMVLGTNRARAAADVLRTLGVADDRISTVSYGEELPLDPGHNEAAWAKNRRAHFNVK